MDSLWVYQELYLLFREYETRLIKNSDSISAMEVVMNMTALSRHVLVDMRTADL